ncbi:MAG: RNA polymerase sigma factor RpoD/SigA [Treponema sp.]|jgi:RNA polymerase primary sigma factor|nr:RNA polymerase sigma factor RpoD/SigA [Treponema sp.]
MNKKNVSGSGDDVLKTYMQEIKRFSLLDFAEELELSRQIQQGSARARRKLVEANLRLVVKIARSYVRDDISFLDIIQEGNMGLMRAAEKYDYSKNVRFSTYAAWWIRQYIARFLVNRRRVIRLPHRKEEIYRKIQRSYHTLSQTLMHQPRSDEIAESIGVTVEDVESILTMTSTPISLEPENEGDENSSFMELHEDYTYNPERDILREDSRREVLDCLANLKDRERRILMYRYELGGCERHTLKKIGDKMGISPETVRQIELRALKKIRTHAEEIRSYLNAG